MADLEYTEEWQKMARKCAYPSSSPERLLVTYSKALLPHNLTLVWRVDMQAKSLLLPRAIRQARQKHHWTQIDLAQRMDVSQGTISFWERGVESPSLEHQIQLVTLLPQIFEQLAVDTSSIIARLYQLERALGKCSCQGCDCSNS